MNLQASFVLPHSLFSACARGPVTNRGPLTEGWAMFFGERAATGVFHRVCINRHSCGHLRVPLNTQPGNVT